VCVPMEIIDNRSPSREVDGADYRRPGAYSLYFLSISASRFAITSQATLRTDGTQMFGWWVVNRFKVKIKTNKSGGY